MDLPDPELLPDSELLPNTTDARSPYLFTTDDTFPFKPWMMKMKTYNQSNFD